MKVGGFDFLEKPFSAEKIAVTVKRCLEMSTSPGAPAPGAVAARRRAKSSATRLPFAKWSPTALKVAETNATVLITGESGAGKELVANCIHAHSERAGEPFVKVNCSAISENLVESELFGHERGAFTGAVASRQGIVRDRARGVIFLDEIADLAASAQAKILRVLQNGEIQRVGSERVTTVDVRILSGTHKDLKVARGRRALSRRSFLPAQRRTDPRARACANARKIFRCWSQFLMRQLESAQQHA